MASTSETRVRVGPRAWVRAVFAGWRALALGWQQVREGRAQLEHDRQRLEAERAGVQEQLDAAVRVAADAARELRSARQTIADRDAELERQELEIAKLQATVTLREHEVRAHALWQERARKSMEADIALQVAREQRALHPTARAGAGE